jgi:hypothetical protein
MPQAPEQAIHAFMSPRKSLHSDGQTQCQFFSRDRTTQRIDSAHAWIWSKKEMDTGGLPSDHIISGPLPPPQILSRQIGRTAVNPRCSWIHRTIKKVSSFSNDSTHAYNSLFWKVHTTFSLVNSSRLHQFLDFPIKIKVKSASCWNWYVFNQEHNLSGRQSSDLHPIAFHQA